MDSVPYFRSALETSRFEIYRRQHSSCWSKEKQIGFVDAERVRQYKYMNIVLVTGMGSKSQCTFSYFALVCWCRWLCKCASLSICDEQIESHIVPRISPNFLVLPCVVSVPVICPFRVSDHFQSFFFTWWQEYPLQLLSQRHRGYPDRRGAVPGVQGAWP